MSRKAVHSDFEANLEKLEKIVLSLERGELPLEKAIDLFREGKALASELEKRLKAFETEIQLLVGQDGAQPLSLEEEELSDD